MSITTARKAHVALEVCALRPDVSFSTAAALTDAAADVMRDDTREGIDAGTLLLSIVVGRVNARQLVHVLDGTLGPTEAMLVVVEPGETSSRPAPADPFPLLEETADPSELPTVDEWLGAGAPMREVEMPLTASGRPLHDHNRNVREHGRCEVCAAPPVR